eukprot:5990057-Prymnesium_polylepis.1
MHGTTGMLKRGRKGVVARVSKGRGRCLYLEEVTCLEGPGDPVGPEQKHYLVLTKQKKVFASGARPSAPLPDMSHVTSSSLPPRVVAKNPLGPMFTTPRLPTSPDALRVQRTTRRCPPP